jgi:hypothetical protein
VSACNRLTFRQSASIALTPSRWFTPECAALPVTSISRNSAPLRPVTTLPVGRPGSPLNTARALRARPRSADATTETRFPTFNLFLYCSQEYARRHGIPRNCDELQHHVFTGYIDDLLAIHAVRWLDELVSEPQMSFKSNSILAQCNAAVSGLGIVLLPTFVAAGVKELQRIAPEINVQREVWVSVRTEQAHFARIESVTQFLEYIFKRDADFLLGKTEALESL